MDDKVDFIISTLKMTTQDNKGVVIEVLGVKEGVLRIKYFEGTNEECPECVMEPESFKSMVLEMCKIQAPYVTEVELLPAN